MKIFYTCFVILLVMFSSWLHGAAAQQDPAAAWMPDANLRAAVREALDLGPNDTLTQQRMQELSELFATNRQIADITGLEYATQLEILFLDNNQIVDISPLAGLTQLNHLDLADNQIVDVFPLIGLIRLVDLDLSNNRIRVIGSPNILPNLAFLRLSGNPIADLSPLANLDPRINLYDLPQVHLRTPIYWTENGEGGGIYRADPGTSGISRVVGSDNLLVGIALDLSAGKIYWTGDRTQRANLDGSNVEDLGVGGEAIALDTSRGKMYWTEWRERNNIKRANLDGSNVEDIVTGLGSPRGIALDVSARKMYWADLGRDKIQRANLDGTGIEDVVTGLDSPNGIALDLGSRKIYWVEEYSGRVRRANLDGSNVETIVTVSGQLVPIALDTINKKVYWGVSSILMRANLDGSNVEIVATRSSTYGIAIGQVRPPSVAIRSRTPSSVAMDRVVFNEIRNASEDKNDWIELKNISDEAISLTDWEISIVPDSEIRMYSKPEDAGEDMDIVAFPDYTLPAGGILLIVNTDPSNTDLIRGQDITNSDRNLDVPPQYLIAPELRLPDAPYLLILRSARDKNGKPEAFEDLAGNYFRATAAYDTQIWPLRDTLERSITKAPLTQGKAWKRVSTEKRGYDAGAWAESGYQSGIGYRPGVSTVKSLGTPGYPDGAVISDVSATGQVSFSEVMFASKGGLHSLSQWMELYNNSDTEVVNLKGWSLEIEVRDADGRHRHGMISLNDLHISPNQTVLIVTWTGRSSGHFSDRRVYNFFRHHSDEFEQDSHRNQVLSADGFSLKLSDADGTLVDVIGNLDGDSKTEDEPMWVLPSGITEDDVRSSIIRRYEGRAPLDGSLATSWRSAAEVSLKVETYWGKKTDIGNPGYRSGGILPVGLSSFRSDRTESGVVVTWVTRSETDNAGFNILRSETRNGQFVRINATLIQGAGTTSEAHHYRWQDTTAKPNVVYYYQIEDVSFSGDRRRLATVRMRGHISASGKLRTSWGDLKVQE